MLSYRHGFHAGGWADVHKHVVLAALLGRLREKETPLSFVDAFAGDGIYDLTGAEAVKTGEFHIGIARLFGVAEAPPAITSYLSVVRAMNPLGELRAYPGSPALARALLRADDRLVLNELHPTAY